MNEKGKTVIKKIVKNRKTGIAVGVIVTYRSVLNNKKQEARLWNQTVMCR